MRNWRSLWRNVLPPHVSEEIGVWLGVLIGLGALLMLYASLAAQSAHADEFPRDVGADSLLFKSADGGYAPAAPLATDIRLSVAGIVARVRVAQRFANSSAEFIEAVSVLPLPDDAAVDRLRMRIGERVIEGEIEERQQAERTYDAARAAGQRTSLVRQTSARRKIEQLIDSRVAGADESLIRKLVLETALEHHLVSPYTSLVAVDKTPVRPTSAPLERREVPNAVPAGAQWTTAFPQTATPAPLLRVAGVFALLLAAVLGVRRRFLSTRSAS